MSIIIRGFYDCPNPECGRIHTYYPAAYSVMHCACGWSFDQVTKARKDAA